ncbi:MAG: 3-deoxy-manno-octulosonate cytidylyltransferase [Rickettsiaceae bacterium]|nr:3-deoxy-manno-octulosonate cytidylyltransferase [Rickettsiaceae bacterium]
MNLKDFVIIIPSRIGSTRLPRKPLVKIGDKLLIEHIILNLKDDFVDNLYIATDSHEIASLVESLGVNYIMTGECNTGTDRVYQAFQKLGKKVKYIINLQGDMPFVTPQLIKNIVERLEKGDCDIATAIIKTDKQTIESESNVSVVIDKNDIAMYFSRCPIPYNSKEFHYHMGVYGFCADALTKFVNLPQTKYELSEKLEQLRALENGMKIGVCIANEAPISVDTEEDLAKAIQYYNKQLSK